MFPNLNYSYLTLQVFFIAYANYFGFSFTAFGEQLAAMRRGNQGPPHLDDRSSHLNVASNSSSGDYGPPSSQGMGGPVKSNAGSGPYVHGLVINGEKTLDIMVPGVKVGYIIGKGGEMIRTLQERAGVKMTIFQQTSEASDQPKQLRVVGAPDKVDYAKELINDLLTEKVSFNLISYTTSSD